MKIANNFYFVPPYKRRILFTNKRLAQCSYQTIGTLRNYEFQGFYEKRGL